MKISKEKPEVKPEIKKPQKFPIKKLRENCRQLFGISTSVFDGAAHNLNGDFTVSEMKKIIETWLKKEAK